MRADADAGNKAAAQGRTNMGLIRLFLASVVVVSHYQTWMVARGTPQPMPYMLGFNGGLAVLFFYVISGFLITYTLARNYAPNASGTVDFYFNRFVRIFSVYWPLAAIVLWRIGGDGFSSATPLDQFTRIFLIGMDWNIVFTGHWTGAITLLHQAWTLGAELTFYLIAPFVIRSRKAIIALIIASLCVRAGAHILFPGRIDLIYFFFPSTIAFFMMGALAVHAGEQLRLLKRPELAFGLLAICVAAIFQSPSATQPLPRV